MKSRGIYKRLNFWLVGQHRTRTTQWGIGDGSRPIAKTLPRNNNHMVRWRGSAPELSPRDKNTNKFFFFVSHRGRPFLSRLRNIFFLFNFQNLFLAMSHILFLNQLVATLWIRNRIRVWYFYLCRLFLIGAYCKVFNFQQIFIPPAVYILQCDILIFNLLQQSVCYSELLLK